MIKSEGKPRPLILLISLTLYRIQNETILSPVACLRVALPSLRRKNCFPLGEGYGYTYASQLHDQKRVMGVVDS